MFRSADEDDDDLFTPSSRTKLSSIFQTSTQSEEDIKSLTYSAPRQPTKLPKNIVPPSGSSHANTSKPSSKVVLVTTIYAFKYVENTYDPLGKAGLAFVKTGEESFHIILYKNPNQHIFNIRLHPKIQFTVQEDKYLTFYDDNKQNWSILFETDEDLKEFRKKLDETDAVVNDKPAIVEVKKEVAQETDSETQESKANLLNRMARMGQPVLVSPKADLETDQTDSDIDRTTIPRKSRRPKRMTDQKVLGNEIVKVNDSVSPVNDKQIVSVNLGEFINDSRACSNEVRDNLNKLETKIDRIYEEQTLSRKIMELRFENEKLRFEMQRKETDSLKSGEDIGAREIFDNAKIEVDLYQNKEVETIEQLQELLSMSYKQKTGIVKLKAYLEIRAIFGNDGDCMEVQVEDCCQENLFIEKQLNNWMENAKDSSIKLSLELTKMRMVEDLFYELEEKMKDSGIRRHSIVGILKQKLQEYNQYFKTIKLIAEQLEILIGTLKIYLEKINHLQTKIEELENYYKNDIKVLSEKTTTLFEPPVPSKRTTISETASNLTKTEKIDNIETDIEHSRTPVAPKRVKTNLSENDLEKESKLTFHDAETETTNNVINPEEAITNESLTLATLNEEKLQKQIESLKEDYDNQIITLQAKIQDYENQVMVYKNTDIKFKKIIPSAVKEEMNGLFAQLQEFIKDDCKNEVMLIMVQKTFKIIQAVDSHISSSEMASTEENCR